MKNKYITGIDVGTHSIKIIIAEAAAHNEQPRIIHAVESPSHGFRHGYVTEINAATKSLSSAIQKMEMLSKTKIESARFSISGAGLSSQYVRTDVVISNKNNEITDSDINDIIQRSEELFSQKYPNKKILHIIPIKYLVDDSNVLGSPVGIYGSKLEAKILFITILEHHYDAFVSVVEKNNISIDDLITAPVAGAESAASYRQKSQGCIIIDIGSETTSLATFEDGIITSLSISNIGSNDITNDIALCLQTSLDEAEDIKIQKNKDHPKRKVDEIIHARIADILDLTEKHLLSIKKNRLLPAGIIFSGGGSRIEFIEEHAKKTLFLPSEKTAIYKYSKRTKRNSNIGPQFSVAYGLCFTIEGHQSFEKSFSFKKIKKQISNLFNQITP